MMKHLRVHDGCRLCHWIIDRHWTIRSEGDLLRAGSACWVTDIINVLSVVALADTESPLDLASTSIALQGAIRRVLAVAILILHLATCASRIDDLFTIISTVLITWDSVCCNIARLADAWSSALQIVSVQAYTLASRCSWSHFRWASTRLACC